MPFQSLTSMLGLMKMDPGTFIIGSGLMAITLYTLYGAIYRLYFSPIAKFPGPKLAALTLWYEFYFDVIRSGSYWLKIGEMHKKYGPIVRINPYELHVADHAFLDTLYPTVTKSVDKWSWSAGMFGSTDMTFGTVAHSLHKTRRGAFSGFFSKASIRRLEPVIQSFVAKLCDRLEEKVDTGEPVDMVHAYAALTQDVIMEYCFSDCKNILDMKDFSPWHYDVVQSVSELIHLIKHFPYFLPSLSLVPYWLLRTAAPLLTQFRADCNSQICSLLSNPPTPTHPTIFPTLLSNRTLPPSELSLPRLASETQGLVGAGTLTSTHMLSLTTYHILANPSILSTLLHELRTAVPDPAHPPPTHDLETLPYLSAIINEGLRLSYGSLHRLQRVHPVPLTYNNWTIPPHTPIGMSPPDLHNNPTTFPSPYTFDPSRWLGPEKAERRKWLLNFGRGTRRCVGMNLAMAEIHLVLAMVFGRFGGRMRLWGTERARDVDVRRDCFVTAAGKGTRGVRVVFEGVGKGEKV